MLTPLERLAGVLTGIDSEISDGRLDIEGAWAHYNAEKKEFSVESVATRKPKTYAARRMCDVAGVMRRFHLQAVQKRIERGACVQLAEEKMAVRLAKVKAKCPAMAVTAKGAEVYINGLLVVEDHVALNVPLHMIQEIWRMVH